MNPEIGGAAGKGGLEASPHNNGARITGSGNRDGKPGPMRPAHLVEAVEVGHGYGDSLRLFPFIGGYSRLAEDFL